MKNRKSAITRLQAMIVAAIILVAAIAGGAFYWYSTQSAAKEPIYFGFISPLSSPGDAVSGQAMEKVVDLFANETNANGGILGRRLEIVKADQTLDPGTAINHLARFVTEKKIAAVFGLWESSVALPVAGATEDYPTIMFVTLSWADNITSNHYKYVFRLGQYNSAVAHKTVEYFKWANITRVVSVCEQTEYGLGIYQAGKTYAATHYPQLNMTQIIVPLGLEDYTSSLLPIKTMSPTPEVILLYVNAPHGFLIHKQLGEMGLLDNIKLVHGADIISLGDPASFWGVVGQYALGSYVVTWSSPYYKPSDFGNSISAIYKQAYGQDPYTFQLWLWDCLRITAKAIQDTGSTNPDTLRTNIENIQMNGTYGPISFQNDPTPGSIFWHQWTGFDFFVFKFNATGQTPPQGQAIWPPVG